MRVLITGGTGLLAKSLIETLPDGIDFRATHHRRMPPAQGCERFRPLEIRDEKSVEELLREFQPQVIIHTASVGSVDEAERDPGTVRSVNVDGTGTLLKFARAFNPFLIHVSSNAVFDGEHPPYAESAPTGAVNRYGRMKIEAEQEVQASGLAALIVRPILMYGWPFPGGRGNVVTRWLEAFEKGEPVKVDREIISMPLYAPNCAEVIWEAVRRRPSGIVHVAGRDRLPLSEFARWVARLFAHPERLVIPVPGSDLNLAAPRPKDTSFETLRMEREFGVTPLGVEEGLKRMRQVLVAR